MSLDKLLYDIDEALISITDNVERLLTVATIFLPIFIISFAIFIILLVALLIVSIFLQFKRLRLEYRRRNLSENSDELPPGLEKNPQKKSPLPAGTYRRVASDPRLHQTANFLPFTPTIIEPQKERRFPLPSADEPKIGSFVDEKKLPLKQRSSIPVTMLLSSTVEEKELCLKEKDSENDENKEKE